MPFVSLAPLPSSAYSLLAESTCALGGGPPPIPATSNAHAHEQQASGEQSDVRPNSFGSPSPPPHGAIVFLESTSSDALANEPWIVQHSMLGVSFYSTAIVGAGVCEDWSPQSRWRPFHPKKPSRLTPQDKIHLATNDKISRELWASGGQLCGPPPMHTNIRLLLDDIDRTWLVNPNLREGGLLLSTCQENTHALHRSWMPCMPWLPADEPIEDAFNVRKLPNRLGYVVSHLHTKRATDIAAVDGAVLWATRFNSSSGGAQEPELCRDQSVVPCDALSSMVQWYVRKDADAGQKRRAEREKQRHDKRKDTSEYKDREQQRLHERDHERNQDPKHKEREKQRKKRNRQDKRRCASFL